MTLRYEIFPADGGWCWRCVAGTGEIIARALRPMTQEGCREVVSKLRATLAAPVVCVAE
jgi:hypothetical protein